MSLFYPLICQNQSLIVSVVVNYEQIYFQRRCIFLLIFIPSFSIYAYTEVVVILICSHPNACTQMHMILNINIQVFEDLLQYDSLSNLFPVMLMIKRYNLLARIHLKSFTRLCWTEKIEYNDVAKIRSFSKDLKFWCPIFKIFLVEI